MQILALKKELSKVHAGFQEERDKLYQYTDKRMPSVTMALIEKRLKNEDKVDIRLDRMEREIGSLKTTMR